MDERALLQGLTEAQAAAVTSDGAPLCILAGAGSGKTRVLTRRIAWRVATGSADAGHVLALTFTRKAAGELRSRLAKLGVRQGVAAGTFHAIAYAQLRQRWADTGEAAPTLLERKGDILRRIVDTRAVKTIDVAAEIEWAKARLVGPAQYEAAALAAGRRPPLSPSQMASVYERYEDEKRKRGKVDFDDLLVRCIALLRDDAQFAATQRWRFRHVFVDEFQDVNPAQAALLAGWRGDRDDLCVVGDPNQAIYSWNGADPSFLLDFARDEPGATIVRLDDNFRSTPQVLAVAAGVLPASRLRANQPDGLKPTVRAYRNDRDEAVGIARGVRDRHRPGTPWSDIAVLTRTNAQLVLLQESMRRAGIPCRVRGDVFLRHPDVRNAVDDIRTSGGSLEPHLVRLAAVVRDLPDADGPAAERAAMLQELVRLGHELLATDAQVTAEWFVEWLHVTLASDQSGGGDAVELATFHAAKGLEWPVVFLAGLEKGFVPIARGDDDEERRLLYVAVTRAERELHCSWARQRAFGEQLIPRQPSPWLDEMFGRAPVAAEPRTRRKVGAAADQGVLGALKAWRSAAARAAGVPAYVIFHDTTLAAVAEAQPTSRASLLSLPGLGPVKAERYGDDLLRVVAEHRAS